MRVLITGIAGFIGSHVADKFYMESHHVFGIDDLSTGNVNNLHTVHGFEKSDISFGWDAVGVIQSFLPDVIIHLAAQPSLIESKLDPFKDQKINILGTLNVLRGASVYGVKHIIFASTSAVYHPSAGLPIKETGKISPESNYGTSKLAAEYYCLNSGIPATVLRFGNVYGPRQVPLGENQLIPRLLSHIYRGTEFSIYGNGEQVRDYVYVTDVAEAIYVAVTKRLRGVYNVSSFAGMTTNSIVNIVKEETGFNQPIEHTEARDTRNVVLSNIKISPYWTPKIFMRKGIRMTIEEWKK